MKTINLISGPRNLSTALMYAFAQHPEMKVIDEPFYAYYLTNGAVKITHPSTSEILEALPHSKEKVLSLLQEISEESQQHLFVKGMAHHFLSKRPEHILNWNNVILIRHPKKLLASFSKVIEEPTIDDIGIKKASEIFTYLKNNNKTPIVIDSDELLKNPKNYLEKLCALLEVSFTSDMLTWKTGGIREDGVWASHWYANVHKSTGFAVQKTSSQPMPSRLEPVLKEALGYYNTLKNHILKNT